MLARGFLMVRGDSIILVFSSGQGLCAVNRVYFRVTQKIFKKFSKNWKVLAQRNKTDNSDFLI